MTGITELSRCQFTLTDVFNFVAQEHLLEIKPDLDLTLKMLVLTQLNCSLYCDLKQSKKKQKKNTSTFDSQGHC